MKPSLFAEFLVIGYMGCVWLAMLMFALLGPPVGETYERAAWVARHAQTLVILGLTAFAYFLGILIDQAADSVMGIWDRRIRVASERAGEPTMLEMQADLFTNASEVVERYEYIQRRLRISRAAVFNVGAMLVLVPFMGLGPARVFPILLVGAGLWAASVFSYYAATRFYWARLMREYAAKSRPRAESEAEV